MKLFKEYFENHNTEEFPTLEKRVQFFEKKGQEVNSLKVSWTTDRITFYKTCKAAKASMKESN